MFFNNPDFNFVLLGWENPCIRIGYFSELYKNTSLPSIMPYKNRGAYAEDILQYLNKGSIYAFNKQQVIDPWEGNKIGSLTELTDGLFVWPKCLGYVVRNYRVKLPMIFTMFIRHPESLPEFPERELY